jgi:hypothetical protein
MEEMEKKDRMMERSEDSYTCCAQKAAVTQPFHAGHIGLRRLKEDEGLLSLK